MPSIVNNFQTHIPIQSTDGLNNDNQSELLGRGILKGFFEEGNVLGQSDRLRVLEIFFSVNFLIFRNSYMLDFSFTAGFVVNNRSNDPSA